MSPTITRRRNPAEQAEEMRDQNIYTPIADIAEDAGGLVLMLDVPGVTADGVDINFERGRLTIHATAKPRSAGEKAEFLLQEYGVGDFRRAFELGDALDADNISASLADGVLTIRLPKSPDLLPRKITVQSAN